MDAITLLETEHDKVRKLLTELESTTERGVKTRAASCSPRSRAS